MPQAGRTIANVVLLRTTNECVIQIPLFAPDSGFIDDIFFPAGVGTSGLSS